MKILLKLRSNAKFLWKVHHSLWSTHAIDIKICNIIVKDQWSLSYSFHILKHYLLEISEHWKILEEHGFCIKSQNTVNHRSSFFSIACFKSTCTSPDQVLIATIKYWLCSAYQCYDLGLWGLQWSNHGQGFK